MVYQFKLTRHEAVLDKRMVGKNKEKYWYTYIKRRIEQNKNFLGFISGQTGCLEENTEIKVLKDNKIIYKKIKDINNDIVVSYNFKSRKFEYNKSELINKGLQDVYKITFSDGDSVMATKDHVFFRPNGEDISVETLMDKKERYRIACRNYPSGKRISKIEYIGKRNVYDLTVENTHNYVLKNGIISHNSGKSYSCMRICEDLDPDFNIDRIVFSAIELIKLINSNTLKKGSCILFDEMSIDMDNRNWNSILNKMINYLLQTFRYKGFIMLMNSPFMDFVDSKTRKLFHAELIASSIDFDKKEAVLKPHLITYDSRVQKFYFKRLFCIVAKGKGGCYPINFWRVPLPSEKLRKDYEAKKKLYTDELNAKIERELLAAENPEPKKGNKKDIDMEAFTKDVVSGLTHSALCNKYNMGFSTVQKYKKQVKDNLNTNKEDSKDTNSSQLQDMFDKAFVNLKMHKSDMKD